MEQKKLEYANEKIHIPIIVPATIAILLLLAGAIASLYVMQERYLTSNTYELINAAEKSFYSQLNKDAVSICGIMDFVKEDRQLQNIWLSEDRQSLLNYSEPIFKKIESKYDITHFYFHSIDKINFLRVHQPERYGDRIDRFTLASAADNKKAFWGIELGPLGTFTLRVVEPWYINGSLTGFLEMGKEISYIIPEINKTFQIESFHIINKTYLNKTQWQQGMKMLGFNSNWDVFEDYAAIDYNSSDLQGTMTKIITHPHNQHKKMLFESQINGRDYYVGFISLIDAGGRQVGDIVIMKNITPEKTTIRIFTIIITVLGSIIGGLLLALFNLYIRRIECKLSSTYAELRGEINKRKKTQEQLHLAYEQMEGKVKERTLELSDEIAVRKKAEDSLINLNSQLEHTIKKLTTANYELEEFARISAHDLKSPLRAIGSLAGIMHTDYGEKLDSQGRELLDIIIARSIRMDKQLSGVLRYSEIHRGREQEQAVDLNILLHQMANDFAVPTDIEVIIENQFPVILCEIDLIKQLFECLLDNAVKFMDKPNGWIRIACGEQEDFWKFTVEDNGRGIETKYFDKIFKIFHKLSRSDEFESTGIGLAIAKKIVEEYGGRIWVESEIGKGSTFFFTFPKQQACIESSNLQINNTLG